MAPALTEPVTQSKLSSPATAASPHPDIHSSTNSTLVDDHQSYYSVRQKSSGVEVSSGAATKGSFQLAFVESVGIEASNGLAESGPVDDSTHMDQTVDDRGALGDTKPEKAAGKAAASSSAAPQTAGATKSGDYMKESAEIEQFMGELASSSDIDLFQVFKSFENAAQAGDGLCDLVAPFNIFGDDVMSVEEVTASQLKDSDTVQLRQEIEKRQYQMQRKCDFLLRRLRKLQVRFMGAHVSEEIAGLFEHTCRLLKRKERDGGPKSVVNPGQVIIDVVSTGQFIPPAGSGVVQSQQQQPVPQESPKPLNQVVLRSYLKRIENVALTQNSMAQKRSAAVVMLPGGKGSPAIGSLLPNLEEVSRGQLEHTSGLLRTELRAVESAMDSDATATSSGGESADELVNYTNPTQQTLSIAKRAAWRWSKDRAAIATRWSWLLAQISDLEYRIRQHNDLQNQIRKSKGAVTFEEPPPQHSVNGYRGVLPGNSKATTDAEDGSTPNGAYDQQSGSSSRTRPFQRSGFKKRKLLQTANLHTISKKAARSSTVKCGCQWPVHPCALCTGRQDPTAPRDLPDMMPVSDRVALLDPCYHPVLSFPEDVSQNIHFESVLRIPEWQVKVVRCTTKAPLKSATTTPKASILREDRVKQKQHRLYDEPARKLGRKFSQGLVTNRIKKAKARRALHGKYSQLLKHHKNRKVAGTKPSSTSGSDTAGLHHDIENGLPRSKNSSPTLNSSYKHERSGYSDLRRNRNSYDIDNIVIPYSVAAATRVEILPYKEIPTPKWKVVQEKDFVVEVENESSQTDLQIESEETLNDAISSKHERSLLDERKKFSTFLKFPYSTRSRANRRIDSRAESSGANTPDPTSPSVAVDQESIPSPACPSTPLTPLEHGEGATDTISTPTAPIPNPLSNSTLLRSERRRTTSLRLLTRDRDGGGGGSLDKDARRSNTPDLKETIPPYESLVFPLPDDIYEAMLQAMPTDHLVKECVGAKRLTCKATTAAAGHTSSMGAILNESESNTLMDNILDIDSDAETDSVISATAEEDPNDPEWFVEAHERL
ncbi:KAT8 regulatory NSL complex subunit 1 [Phlebotomus argentipes]|uniref:KAT8 regulatory NSL complex subunit 1 n=1 Tax=Phlebotomus argentipes TaxID=94469 RepID=UPI002892CAEC|nr:KAT8 regulatory NSL complex subunit 1 [Phlebotomus argentipes]XP_059621916.1 KAT8 regulatory NSL complex subunit 1 [Phlebotomus argentipes]